MCGMKYVLFLEKLTHFVYNTKFKVKRNTFIFEIYPM